MSCKSIDTTKTYRHLKEIDSVYINFEKINSKIIGDYLVINKENLKTYKLAKKDSITKYSTDIPYYYKDETKLSFKEFKEDIKIIKGYSCF